MKLKFNFCSFNFEFIIWSCWWMVDFDWQRVRWVFEASFSLSVVHTEEDVKTALRTPRAIKIEDWRVLLLLFLPSTFWFLFLLRSVCFSLVNLFLLNILLAKNIYIDIFKTEKSQMVKYVVVSTLCWSYLQCSQQQYQHIKIQYFSCKPALWQHNFQLFVLSTCNTSVIFTDITDLFLQILTFIMSVLVHICFCPDIKH